MNNLTIKNKLLLFSLLTLFVIFIYSIKIANTSYNTYEDSKKTNSAVILSIKISSVLHELQKERGTSTGFLINHNKKFLKILNSQRINTNLAIKNIKQFYQNSIFKDIDKIDIKRIEQIRKEIDSLSITAQQAFTFYTEINTNLLKNIKKLSNITNDVEIKNSFDNFLFFINAREKAGQERAVLSRVFGKNKFSLDLFYKFSTLVSEQKTFLKLFIENIDDKTKLDFLKLQKNNSFKNVEILRSIVLLRKNTFDTKSIHWFNTITKKINKLKEFENQLTNRILNLSNMKAKNGLMSFIIVFFITILVLILSIYLSYSISKGINKSYKEIKDLSLNLENKVKSKTKYLNKQLNNIKLVKQEIEDIHAKTRESIEYAAIIQGSFIPNDMLFKRYFTDSFNIWQPKDTVGGDIYLFNELRDKNECLLMYIDCTGHGIPGAFVTMLVKAVETQIIAEIMNKPDFDISPAKIIKHFNKTLKKLLNQENKDSISNVGWDGGVIYYNKKDKILKFAGAETSLFYIDTDNSFHTIKGDRYSVGYKKCDENYNYNDTVLNVKKGMKFYCTTDGYLDQNGGEKDFPFGKTRFSNIIKEHHTHSMITQKRIFLEKLHLYENKTINNDRNDDITVIGFEV